MTRSRRILLAGIATLAVVITAGAAWLLVGGVGGGGTATTESTDPGVAASEEQAGDVDTLVAAFFDDWVDDGRVVRRDQGDDTVSEGQAYAMLLAVAADDEKRFDEVWSWTQENLQRPDGLLAWRWQDGAVVDDEPASDAELDASRALVLAGERFDRADLAEDGSTLGTLLLDRMTVQTDVGRILLPGVWANDGQAPYDYNPGYASPVAFAVLGAATGDPRWQELAAGSAAVTDTILASTSLPPDWAQVQQDGTVAPMPGAQGTGQSVRYSYDATRLGIRYAESCDPGDRRRAALLAPTLERSDPLAVTLDLGGSALEQGQHPIGYVARAAAASAAGQTRPAEADLATARSLSGDSPTYYGAAWIALGTAMLATDALGGCPGVDEGALA